ncbi:serine/threonine-protein kinase [Paraoerskovia marina]|uniref:Protein kinase domain-containing protein n=1 Tax=Paraoerskovia marina TaxID=545619 RepID=A0A1H1Q2N0_9CELL|nr:serine/threonine-protein kinase [Paraoerskovia marina]SDS17507.1 Protein kinase domain-containing protein [Paraoerskovia marina]
MDSTGGIAAGTELGGYRVESRLGAGAMGSVYRATDGGGRSVALKVLHSHVDADTSAQGRERLRREAAALRRLDHPAVAAILDVELEGADAFIVTELVEGISLEDEIRDGGPLGPDDLLALAEELAEALRAVHAAGVVHRDLKPSNVLVTDEGPVLIDFGIAHGLDDARMTSSGLVMGTPGYLAPELLSGSEPGTESDWWGWAALLAYAATGRAPFGVRPVEAVLARARTGDADLEGLGAHTYGALHAALRPEPSQRMRPDQVITALSRAADDGDRTPAESATQVVGGVVPLGAVDANDGRTRAVGVDPVGVVQSEPEVPGYVRPQHRRRPWAAGIAGVALVLYAGSAPGVAFVVLAVLVVVLRLFGVFGDALHSRRERRGVSRSDGAMVALASPYLLLRTVVGALGGLLVGGCAAVLIVAASWWLLEPGRLQVSIDQSTESLSVGGRNEDWVYVVVLCLAMTVAVLFAWFGPASRLTRVGSRTVMAAVASGTVGTVIVLVVVLAAAVAAAVLLASGSPVEWWPLSEAPTLS